MKPTLILFASSHGQTRSIAMTIAHELRVAGLDSVVLNAASDALPSPDAFELVVIGSRIHFGRHAASVLDYMHRYRASLREMPTGFFSVSMAATDGGTDPNGYLDTMVEGLGWRPAILAAIGGGLPYRRYNWALRFAMKQLSRVAGHPTDTSCNHELTDWDRVQLFAEDVANLARKRFAARAAIAARDPLPMPRGIERHTGYRR